MQDWKRTFVDKLNQAQSKWVKRFEELLDSAILPTFDEMASFVRNHGFSVSQPMKEQGRRSFKFELAENAYLLMIFRSTGIGEFELRSESFVPGCEPMLTKACVRICDADKQWTERQFESALNNFVESLAGAKPEPVEELVAV